MTDRTPTPGRSRRRFTVDALFTDTRLQATGVTDLANAKDIELGRIQPDPDQPRRSFDEDRLDELAASIRAEGILQPIVVRYDDSRDVYVIVHGERRWRAAAMAEQASIPALVRDVPPDRRLLQQLMENVVRDDLNAIDRAAALRQLRHQLGDVPWEQVADAVGIKRSRLFQLLGTEKLPEQAQADIQQGRLSEKQSRALQGLSGPRQDALRQLIVDTSMPAQTATRLARALKTLSIDDEDPDAVHEALGRLYDLVDPSTPEAMQGQVRAVFDAIRSGTGDEIAALLAAPRFDPARMAREVSTLARTLSRVDRDRLAQSPDTESTLRTLRDTLNALLDDA